MTKHDVFVEKADPKKFNLAAFISGCTAETAFVDVYQDRRLMAELARAKKLLQAALEDEDGDDRPMSLGEERKSVALRRRYEELRNRAESSVLTVEVREIIRSVRDSLTKDFMKERGVTEEDIANDLTGLGADLDFVVLSRGIVYPELSTAEEVRAFSEAIGDAQWATVLDAWTKTMTTRTTLADIDLTF